MGNFFKKDLFFEGTKDLEEINSILAIFGDTPSQGEGQIIGAGYRFSSKIGRNITVSENPGSTLKTIQQT